MVARYSAMFLVQFFVRHKYRVNLKLHIIVLVLCPFCTPIYGTGKIGWQNSALDRTSVLFIKFQFYCGRFAALQNWGIKKDVQITTCKDLAETFTRLVHHETEGYDEVKLIFDHYQENSVKDQTRNKSTQGN